MSAEQKAAVQTRNVAPNRKRRANVSDEQRAIVCVTKAAAVRREIDDSMVEQHNCGSLSIQCEFCKAKHFAAERPINGKFPTCCHKGKVALPPIRSQPLIKQLIINKHGKSNKF